MAVNKREETKAVRQGRTTYYAADGIQIPGVTTITGMRKVEQLTGWAFKVAREYPELTSPYQLKDDIAQIGKAAHAIVTAHIRGEQPDVSDFTPNEVKAAQPSFEKFLRWSEHHKVEILESGDKPFISELYRYGGTPDLYGRVDGKLTVLDFKTGKAIYDEYFYQTAAYAAAIEEVTGVQVDQTWILGIGRAGKTVHEEIRTRDEWLLDFEWFKAMRRVYEVEKQREFVVKKAEWAAEDRANNVVDLKAAREKGVLKPKTPVPA